MSITSKFKELRNHRDNIAAAIETKRVNMDGVSFIDFADKVYEIKQSTISEGTSKTFQISSLDDYLTLFDDVTDGILICSAWFNGSGTSTITAAAKSGNVTLTKLNDATDTYNGTGYTIVYKINASKDAQIKFNISSSSTSFAATATLLGVNASLGDYEWEAKSGNLVTMTSNTSPKPYIASMKAWARGSAYMAFDGNLDNYMYSNNPTADGDITSTLMFGREIRIAEIQSWIGYGGPVIGYEDGTPGNNAWMGIYGLKADGTEVQLGVNNSGDTWTTPSNSKQTHTVTLSNQSIPFVGITCHRIFNGYQGWYRLFDIKITKWYEKV